MKKMTSFEGDTGVYLQYAHVRLASMERKNPNVVLPEDTSLVQTDLLVEERAHDIIYLLALYPDVVRTAYTLSEPSTIVTFAFRLAHAISGAWDGRTSILLHCPSRVHARHLCADPLTHLASHQNAPLGAMLSPTLVCAS